MNDVSFPRHGAVVPSADFAPARGESEPSGDQSRVTPLLVRYLAIARRRKWIILGAIAVSLALGLVITLLMTPLYTATSTIEIQRENYNIVKVEGVEPNTSSIDQEFYQTQYGLLASRSLAERVATDLKLFDDEKFFEMFGAPEASKWFENGKVIPNASTRTARIRKAGNILLENLNIAPLRLSRLVDIQFTSPDPALSAKVVNAWSTHFIGATLERRLDATSYARKFLEDRLNQLRARLEQSERLLVAYASKEGIITLPSATPTSGEAGVSGERSIVADDLAALNNELAQATADRVRAESRLRASGGNVSEALDNNAINGLREKRGELASEYARLMVQFEPDYPAAKALASQIAQLDKAIAREEGRVKNTLEATYRASAERESRLTAKVNQLKSKLIDLRRRSIQYNIYQRDVDTNRELYNGLLQRYKEVGVAGGVGVNNIAIVDDAEVPQKPSSPKLILNMLVSLLAGILLGTGLALALEQVDEAIADPTEVEKALNLPLLGTIPKVEGGDPVDSLQDPKSPVAEAYLSVQTNLSFSTDHGAPRTMAVTSTRPGEGKTTTSYAIANSLARTKRRVLLIDGDMRSPSIHHLFNLKNDRGLSNFLAGDDDFLASIKTGLPNGLSVLTAGPQPPSAPELLTSDRLQKLIQELLTRFDHLIFDAPPVMGLADAPLLGGQMEGAVFVIESHGTRSTMARLAISRLEAAHVHMLGTVLTKFEVKRAHYGYGYDYGYGYGEAAKSSA